MPGPEEPVEMRFKTPRAVADVLDALAHARRCDRSDIANEILLKHCRQVVHEATIVTRVTQSNPRLVDSGYTPLD